MTIIYNPSQETTLWEPLQSLSFFGSLLPWWFSAVLQITHHCKAKYLVLKTGNCCGTRTITRTPDSYRSQCDRLSDRHFPRSLQRFWISGSFFCLLQLTKIVTILGIPLFCPISDFWVGAKDRLPQKEYKSNLNLWSSIHPVLHHTDSVETLTHGCIKISVKDQSFEDSHKTISNHQPVFILLS